MYQFQLAAPNVSLSESSTRAPLIQDQRNPMSGVACVFFSKLAMRNLKCSITRSQSCSVPGACSKILYNSMESLPACQENRRQGTRPKCATTELVQLNTAHIRAHANENRFCKHHAPYSPIYTRQEIAHTLTNTQSFWSQHPARISP